MINADQSLVVSDLLLELAPTGQPRSPFAPIVHAGTVNVSTATFKHIVKTLFSEEIEIPVGKLAFVDCGWQPGGAWLTMKVRSLIQQNVNMKAALAASPNGNLQIRLLDVRAGMLPLNRMLDPLLDQVVKRPGFTRTGPLEIELDVIELLRTMDIPLTLTAKVRAVSADTDSLTLTMGQ